jgi:D-alanyl-D-alanine carboxypeptidase
MAHSRPDASLVINENTGEILYAENAHKEMYPASLTKMMTIYLAFDAIKKGTILFDTPLNISQKAANMLPNKIGLKSGRTITLKAAIMSLIVKSANDSSVVISENLSGSEKNFSKIMNAKAKQLGLTNTYFTNASGWHNPEQKTTAYDIAKLAIALKRDFATFYHLFSQDSFFYKNTMFRGREQVMQHLDGANGAKSGYTSKSGWNIVTTATRGEHALVGVVLGSTSYKARDQKMIKLMNTQFAHLKNH